VTTDYQKNIEEVYALKLSELLKVSWQIESAPNEVDWPDLLINSNGDKFGLEVREIYSDETRKGSMKKAKESSNIQLVKTICNAYYDVSNTPISVKFLGDIGNRAEIISSITNEVQKLKEFEQARLVPYLGSVVFVTKLPMSCGKYNRWVYVSDKVGWVSKLNEQLIQSKISEKAAKLSKYSKNINDVRLLLVCNSLFNSGKYKIPDQNSLKTQGFEAVYILLYPDSICVIGS
jgi:hypothetical protein